MVNNPIFIELVDICDELSKLTEIFDPTEVSEFDYDCGFYSALRSRDVDPDKSDLDLLVSRRETLEGVKDV